MLNNPSCYYYCWCNIFPLYLSQVTLSHLLSPRTHWCPLTHSGSLACTLAYVPYTCVPILQTLKFLWFQPQGPPTPLPSSTLALKLPVTLPTTPTFIPAHRQAPTCSPSLSSPFHTQARLLLLTPSLVLKLTHIPMHTHSLTHTQTRALPGQLTLGSQNLCTYTRTIPGHALVPQLSIPPSDKQALPTSPEAHCPRQTPS